VITAFFQTDTLFSKISCFRFHPVTDLSLVGFWYSRFRMVKLYDVLGLTSNVDASNFCFLFRSKAGYGILVYGLAVKTKLF
jgi:hypothetical protein